MEKEITIDIEEAELSSSIRSSDRKMKSKREQRKEDCLKVLESTWLATVMTVFTVYALYSSDIMVLTTDRESDGIFTAFSSLAFFLFMAEILLQCWCRDDYLKLSSRSDWQKALYEASIAIRWIEKVHILSSAWKFGSFYFWLDLLATVSMIFEIPWLTPSSMDPNSVDSNLDSARAGKASRAGAKAAKVVRIVRMIKLIRLVKLYKYFSVNNKQKKDGAIHPGDSKDEDIKHPKSHVGAEMSDRVTKKVIVGILFMLIVIPLLQADDLDYIHQFGLQMVFESRLLLNELSTTSSQQAPDGLSIAIQDAMDNWKHSEEYFLSSTRCIFLEYDGFNDGYFSNATIPADRPSPNDLRLVEIAPLKINSGEYSMSVIFDNTSRVDEEAMLSVILTTFVVFLLAIGTLTFSRDVNNLVIIPIEKMVQLVRQISANPLGKNNSLNPEEIRRMDDGMETTLLLQTISKIACLMRVGFGEAGAEIIAKNLNNMTPNNENGGSSSSMNLLGNGTKIFSVFGFCDVRNFTDATECLQEEVMLFVNRIAHFLHSIVVQCDGAANKNIGDAFLLTWKVDQKKNLKLPNVSKELNYCADKALYSMLKTMVMMRRHDDYLCNFSPRALGALYERLPKYKCQIGCGLHYGWAVEGAIGSDKKIDASYISPHVNFTEFLESSTKKYGVSLLMSGSFYELLSKEVSRYCRKVDRVRNFTDMVSLYTYDANYDSIEVHRTNETNLVRDIMQQRSQRQGMDRRRTTSLAAKKIIVQKHSADSKRKSGSEKHLTGSLGEAPEVHLVPFTIDLWEDDSDMVIIRQGFNTSCRDLWTRGFDAYIDGNWDDAIKCINEVLNLTGGKDGPAKHLKSNMEKHNFKPPTDWRGYTFCAS